MIQGLAKIIVLACIMLLAAICAHADEVPAASLFFTGDEVKSIGAMGDKNAAQRQEPQDIHLGAVLYYGPQNWVVWVQKKRVTPLTYNEDVQVTYVDAGLVHIRLAQGADRFSHDIALKPYQTYQAATGRIIEGSP